VYQWWVFVHLAGVFVFLALHGVSIWVTVRLRTERDPRRVSELIQLSSSTIQPFYWSLGLLVAAGVVAGFVGHLWSHLSTSAFMWAALIVLILTSVAMTRIASPYYRRVGLVARAKAEGETAVTDEQLDQVLRSSPSTWVMAIGAVALAVILYLMLFKPTFGFSNTPAAAPPGAVVITAHQLAFDQKTVNAATGKAFDIQFDNQATGIPHNVSVYTDSSAKTALFTGPIVTGPKTVTYHVKALDPGSYFFRCDVHPTQMTGTLVVK
jgi:plastocyanin